MINVILLGAIGNPNTGDEAVLQTTLQLLNRNRDIINKVYIFSKNTSYTAFFSDTLELNIIPVSFLHQITLECNFDTQKMKSRFDKILAGDIDGYSDENYLDKAIISIFKDANVLHVIGGGYINSIWPDMLLEVGFAVKMAQKYTVKYLFTGISAYPLESKDRVFFYDMCENATLVDFRDKSCFDLVRSKENCQITIDDAMFLSTSSTDNSTNFVNEKRYANFILHPWINYEDVVQDKIDNIISPFIQKIIKDGEVDYVNLLGFSTGDLEIWKSFIEGKMSKSTKMKIKMIDCLSINSVDVKTLITKAYFNVSTRFHAAVFSLSESIPVLGLYYDPYYRNKMMSVFNLFSNTQCKSIRDINVCDLQNFYSEIPKIKQNLDENHSKVVKLYEKKMHAISHAYTSTESEAQLMYANILQNKILAPQKVPLVSIIIPIFNMEKYLKECLDSVLKQTLNDIEIICINDGSVDNTINILLEYAQNDKRIKIINQTNHGVSYARNQGIKKATGEFLFFIDPDDWMADNKVLEDLYTSAKKEGALVCGGSFSEMNSERGLITKWEDIYSKYSFKKTGWIEYNQYQFDYGWVRFLYNRKFIIENKLSLPQRKFFEDPVFFTKVMSVAKRFYALSRIVYCYRSGHHSYDLTDEKVLHLLRGIKDIATLAIENEYKALLSLEEFRVKRDFAFQIAKYMNEPSQVEIRDELDNLNELFNESNYRIECQILSFVDDVQKSQLRTELMIAHNSFNWKVGKCILFIPKKIYYIVKKIVRRS